MDLETHSLLAMIAGIFVVDVAVQGLQVTNQSVIYKLAPEARARVTTAYICSMFIGGSLGSALASGIYASDGWQGLCLLGGLLPAILIATWIWVNRKGIPHHIKA